MPLSDSMSNLGMAAGAAQGIASGMDAFLRTRSMLNEEALKQKLANTQGVEAYSKLLAAGAWPDQADETARKFGLLPTIGGLLPAQPAVTGLTSPPVGGSSTSASPDMSSGGVPQATASGLSLPSMQYYKNLGVTPQQARSEILKQADPSYQIGLEKGKTDLKKTNYDFQMEPTVKAREDMKPQADPLVIATGAYSAAARQLKQGGEGSPGLVYPMLSRIFNPGAKVNPDIVDAAINQSEIPQAAKTEILNKAKGLSSGDFSDDAKIAIKRLMDTSIRSQIDAYNANASQAEKRWGAPGATRIPSVDEAEKWYRTPLGSGSGGKNGGKSGGSAFAAPPDLNPQQQLQILLQEKARRRPGG